MQTSSDDKLDKALFTWFTQEEHRGTPLSVPIVKEKTLWFHQQLHTDEHRHSLPVSGGCKNGRRGMASASCQCREKSSPVNILSL